MSIDAEVSCPEGRGSRVKRQKKETAWRRDRKSKIIYDRGPVGFASGVSGSPDCH